MPSLVSEGHERCQPWQARSPCTCSHLLTLRCQEKCTLAGAKDALRVPGSVDFLVPQKVPERVSQWDLCLCVSLARVICNAQERGSAGRLQWHRYNSHRHKSYGQARGERPGENQAVLTPGNTSKLPGGFYSTEPTHLGEPPTAQL